jgi:hypothetical protein
MSPIRHCTCIAPDSRIVGGQKRVSLGSANLATGIVVGSGNNVIYYRYQIDAEALLWH